MKGADLNTNVLRAAVLAATRMAKDDFRETSPAVVSAMVLEAHFSLFDGDVDQSTPEATGKFHEAVDLAVDLVNFGRAVRGGNNAG